MSYMIYMIHRDDLDRVLSNVCKISPRLVAREQRNDRFRSPAGVGVQH